MLARCAHKTYVVFMRKGDYAVIHMMEVEVEHLSTRTHTHTRSIPTSDDGARTPCMCNWTALDLFFYWQTHGSGVIVVLRLCGRLRRVTIFNFTSTMPMCAFTSSSTLPLTTLVADIVVPFDSLRCLPYAITVNYRNTLTCEYVA